MILAVLAGCGGEKATPTAQPPVKVTAPVKESALTTVQLTDDAVRRIAIKTAKVERKNVPRTRTYPGRIESVPGSGASIQAPVAGLLVAAGPLAPGKKVERGEVLMRLKPLVAAEADVLARAERDIAVAKARVEQAEARANRLEQLAKDGAASQKAAEEAVTEREVAKADFVAASSRRERVNANPFASDVAMPIRAPDSGTVLRLSAAPGQVVAVGAPLVEIAKVDRAWVRVAVYAGDLATIERTQPGNVRHLGSYAPRVLLPVEAPPLADPASVTVEVVYAVENSDVAFLPGQRILASLPLAGSTSALVVPYASVIYDVHGGAWVYTTSAPNVFTRKRIEIRDVIGDNAVLERGPEPGTAIVVAGVTELYGMEFGSK